MRLLQLKLKNELLLKLKKYWVLKSRVEELNISMFKIIVVIDDIKVVKVLEYLCISLIA